MRWFKHLCDSGDDPDIDGSAILFGSDGPWVFFRTLEIMAREFDYRNPGKNVFLWDFFRKKHRISARKLRKILDFFNKKNRIFYRFFKDGRVDMIELYCPKLKTLCDEHTRKVLAKNPESLRSKSGTTPIAEAEAEAEAEADINKSGNDDRKFDKDFLKNEIAFAELKEIKKSISDMISELNSTGIFKNSQLWVGQQRKAGTNERAILHALIRARIKKDFEKTPQAYCTGIIKLINANYNEGDHIRESNKLKNALLF